MVDGKVVALTGGLTVVGDALVQTIIQAAGIPMIAYDPIAPTSFNAPNVYLPQVPAVLTYQGMMAYALKKEHQTLVAALNDTPAGRAFAAPLEQVLKDHNSGNGFAATVPVPPTTADFGPIGAALNRSGAQGLIMLVGGTNAFGTMRAVEAQGGTVKNYYVPPGFTLSQLQQNAGSALDKVIQPSTFPTYDHPTLKPLRNALEAQKARGDLNADFDKLNPFDFDAWLGIKALIAVTKNLKTISPATVTDALNKAKDVNLTVVPKWTPSTPGPPNFTRVSNQTMWYIGFKNGKQVLLIDHPVNLNDAWNGKF
jgi:ABC-type branched-subunit amino acid transport system substrate-binding protein